LLDLLEALVTAESPSDAPDAVAACGRLIADAAAGLVGERPEVIVVEDRTHLRWRFGTTPTSVVLIGHVDTVWPLGTIERWPFSVTDGVARGPGAFDMKAGIVQLLHGLSYVDDLDGVAVLLTADEEIGSQTSRQLIEDTARGARAALVLEPSAAGALKTARKGVATYEVVVTGRAAHAGLEPEKGANATIEMANAVLAIAAMSRPDAGTTVTPTLLRGGTVANAVPAQAKLLVDVRTPTPDEHTRVHAAITSMASTVPGTSVTVTLGPNRPPLPAASSAGLFERAQRVADRLGLSPLDAIEVGGGSDGNFTAAIGVPTLDGLGAVGGGAHADDEHVIVDTMPERAALVGALVSDLLAAGS
jgi:glutamate carboxypeptidase